MKLSRFIRINCSVLCLCTAITHGRSPESVQSQTKIEAVSLIPAISPVAIAPVSASNPMIDITNGFSKVAEPALRSVVNVATTQIIDIKAKQEGGSRFPNGITPEELFRDFIDPQHQHDTPRRVQSLGSGFIIKVTKDDVFIVTNNHVIAEAKKITVFLHDKTELEAAVHASDERTDIAVLKIKLTDIPASKRNLTALNWGDAENAKIGDWVLAIGNPFGLGSSVTAGIISGKGRDFISSGKGRIGDYVDDFLQHSAQINMGNSGGCLLGMDGRVVGINTAIFSPSGGNVGIGFAIPAGVAKKTVDQLIEYARTKRGWLGIRIQHLTEDMAEGLGLKVQGAIVGGVTSDGPAKKADVQEGDIIVEYDGKSINEQNRLTRLVGETEIGKTVPIKVLRKGKEVTLKITIGEYEEAIKNGKLDDTVKSKDLGTPQTLEILGLTISPVTDDLMKRRDLSPGTKGVLIVKVQPGSSAEDAGLLPGEIIEEVNQKEVKKPQEVIDFINEAKKTKRRNVLLLVKRKGDPRFASLRIEDDLKKDDTKTDDKKKDEATAAAKLTDPKKDDKTNKLVVEHPANQTTTPAA